MDCFNLGKQKQILLQSLYVIAAYMRQVQSTRQELAKTKLPFDPQKTETSTPISRHAKYLSHQ